MSVDQIVLELLRIAGVAIKASHGHPESVREISSLINETNALEICKGSVHDELFNNIFMTNDKMTDVEDFSDIEELAQYLKKEEYHGSFVYSGNSLKHCRITDRNSKTITVYYGCSPDQRTRPLNPREIERINNILNDTNC